jgi:hypothetical protein
MQALFRSVPMASRKNTLPDMSFVKYRGGEIYQQTPSLAAAGGDDDGGRL